MSALRSLVCVAAYCASCTSERPQFAVDTGSTESSSTDSSHKYDGSVDSERTDASYVAVSPGKDDNEARDASTPRTLDQDARVPASSTNPSHTETTTTGGQSQWPPKNPEPDASALNSDGSNDADDPNSADDSNDADDSNSANESNDSDDTSDSDTTASSEALDAGGDPPLRKRGESCKQGTECASNTCQDGYCCDSACTGQCESCAVPGNLGTCLPVTTPRTPCGGEGECAGYCTGTALNREQCVFPGSETACGAEASCTNSTLTAAATCNAEGECLAGGAMSCMFGCDSQGTNCASNCPNGQTLCDGACVATDSDPDHCGASCQVCSGDTPVCSSGKCVECVTAQDCSESGTTCKGDNTCGCSVAHHACGATRAPCYSDTDVTHCGEECIDCRQPNANAACGEDNGCANTCKSSAYTLACPAVGGKPNCSQWDFESNTSEGWELVAEASTAAAGPLVASANSSAAGGLSLAIPYDNEGDESRFVTIRIQLCAGGNVLSLSGKRITWSLRMDDTHSGGYNYLQVYDAPDFGGGFGLFDFNSDDDGDWDVYNFELPAPTFDQVFGLGFHLQTTAQYDGTIYLDDIRVY